MSKSRDMAVLAAAALMAFSQAAGAQALVEDLKIVDSPTAGILGHGAYMFDGSVGPGNDLLFGINVGFHDRMMLGASFGVQNFVGRGEIEVNDRPGFQVRLRLIEEGMAGPAFALGVDTQGEGYWIDGADRYERKSTGVYGALSRNFYMFTNIGVHGGAGYSFEDRDEKGIDFFAGVSVEVIPGMTVLFDYDAALDDDDPEVATTRTRGRGYLDGGVRFDYGENLRIRVLFKDLTGNYLPEKGVARSIEIMFIDWF